jgi:hypothetical protein
MTLVVDRLQDDGTGNSDAVQDIIDGRAKAWARVDNSQNIEQELNISSLTDNGTGYYDLNFNNNFSASSYNIVLAPNANDFSGDPGISSYRAGTTSGRNIVTRNTNNSSRDADFSASFFGTLA